MSHLKDGTWSMSPIRRRQSHSVTESRGGHVSVGSGLGTAAFCTSTAAGCARRHGDGFVFDSR